MRRALVVTAMMLVLSPAVAGAVGDAPGNDHDVRLIVFTQKLTKPDGTPITECTKWSETQQPPACIKTEEITLGVVCYGALSRSKPGQSMTEQAARWRLSRKIYSSAVKLSKPDAAIIMNAISEAGFPTEYSGQAYCMLDPTFCEDEKK